MKPHVWVAVLRCQGTAGYVGRPSLEETMKSLPGCGGGPGTQRLLCPGPAMGVCSVNHLGFLRLEVTADIRTLQRRH